MAETQPNTKSKIDEMKSVISKRGISRSNLFEIDLSAMNGDLGFDSNSIRDLQILITKATVPTRTLATFDYSLYRNDSSFVSGYTNSGFTVDFILTEDYLAKRIFTQWIDLVIQKNQYTVAYKNDYTCDIGIKQLKRDENNTVLYEAKLEGCFPKGISEIPVSSEASTLPAVSVEFLYDEIKFPEDR